MNIIMKWKESGHNGTDGKKQETASNRTYHVQAHVQ
jgi:hypothetical protein